MRRKKILIWVSVVSVIMNTISVSAVSQNTNNVPTEDIIQNDTQSLEQSTSEDPDLSMSEEKNYQDDLDNLTDEAVPFYDANDAEIQEPATQGNISPMSMARTIPGRWIESGGRWWYQHNDGGYTTNGWEEINGIWYHFDSAGWMEVDKWISDGGRWYYVNSSGAMVVENWMLLGGKWYYFDEHGAMVIGWKLLGGAWYFFELNGVMVTGTRKFGKRTAHFESSGKWKYTISLDEICLVDSGGHLDWENESKYGSNITTAMNIWNKHTKGVIRKHNITNIIDVYIEDYYNNLDPAAGKTVETSSSGIIKMNTYQLDRMSENERVSVIMHEFGHALGLGHNDKADVMYEENRGITELTASDKASYDEASKKYK